jgi:putative sigma-54 modulation protein
MYILKERMMNIIINGKHLEITPALKKYSEEKIKKFERYLSDISETVITLSVEKYRHKAEVLLKVNGFLIQAEGVTGEIYSSIDEVSEKLERQIKKYKEKLISYRKGAKRFELKPMSPDEASMQLELLDKDFFIFLNVMSDDINVIYRRRDGNFGLIEPAK